MLALEVRSDPADHRWVRAVGHANIYLNSSLKYKGRPKTGFSCEGEITDLDGYHVTRCSSFAASWWRAMLDHRTYIIQAAGTELARIRRHGFFGYECDISIGGQEFPWPRRGEIALPGATFNVYPQPLEVRVTISDEDQMLAYMGIAFFLWMKRGIDESYPG